MTTALKPRTSQKSDVHRDLVLVSPLMQGPDVEQLQLQLNHLAKHFEFPWHRIQVDGQYGRRTKRLAKFIANRMGLDHTRVEAIGSPHGRIAIPVQHLLRNPEDRSAADRAREEQRRPAFQKLREQHHEGLQAAVQFMIANKGVNEDPAESNLGPFPITACEDWFGLRAVPWCGCLAGYSIESPHGADLGKTGTWWPYAGSIREDAIAGRNGLTDINPADATIGCIATFFNGGDDHVVLIRAETKGGVLFTVEGNTSSAFRDSDGGIIETKERVVAEVTCVAHLTIN